MDELTLEGSFRLSYNGAVFAREGLGYLRTFDHLVDTGEQSGLCIPPAFPRTGDQYVYYLEETRDIHPHCRTFSDKPAGGIRRYPPGIKLNASLIFQAVSHSRTRNEGYFSARRRPDCFCCLHLPERRFLCPRPLTALRSGCSRTMCSRIRYPSKLLTSVVSSTSSSRFRFSGKDRQFFLLFIVNRHRLYIRHFIMVCRSVFRACDYRLQRAAPPISGSMHKRIKEFVCFHAPPAASVIIGAITLTSCARHANFHTVRVLWKCR